MLTDGIVARRLHAFSLLSRLPLSVLNQASANAIRIIGALQLITSRVSGSLRAISSLNRQFIAVDEQILQFPRVVRRLRRGHVSLRRHLASTALSPVLTRLRPIVSIRGTSRSGQHFVGFLEGVGVFSFEPVGQLIRLLAVDMAGDGHVLRAIIALGIQLDTFASAALAV